MRIERFINAPVSSNCYLIVEEGHAIIVDPGTAGSEMLIRRLDELQLCTDYIILTHEHFDHCAGVNSLRKISRAPLWCSDECNTLIQSSRGNYSAYWMEGEPFRIEQAERILSDRDNIEWLGHQLTFYYTPGHSEGSIAITIDKTCLFTGDNYIPHIRTYTNLKGGSKEKLKYTLALFHSLSDNDDMTVYPGHFDTQPIREAQFNQGLRGFSLQQLKNMHSVLSKPDRQ